MKLSTSGKLREGLIDDLNRNINEEKKKFRNLEKKMHAKNWLEVKKKGRGCTLLYYTIRFKGSGGSPGPPPQLLNLRKLMGSKPWLYPASTYRTLETFWDTDEDAPGPRCGHTLTAVAATKTQGPRLILFGGATAIEGGSSSAPGIRLAGVTNTVHSYDVQTRKWTSLKPAGEPPSPRAAHAAAAVGTMVVFQGGIGPAGHSTDDLYVLDLTNDKYKWHRVVVQGQGPGPRYGHVMDLVAQRYLVTVSGNDDKLILGQACTWTNIYVDCDLELPNGNPITIVNALCFSSLWV
ncbi:hypothetical protein V8G54_030547 [Vigna mungo]|uniref:Uncharacterized protein n=1 Tax=Vigna mungo TaxID=3915 RepID=A0AAQ3RLD9_VIGMU